MEKHKQYSEKTVTNIIRFTAQVCSGIQPSREEFELIPEEFRRHILAAVMAATKTLQIKMLQEIADRIPEEKKEEIAKILKEAMTSKE